MARRHRFRCLCCLVIARWGAVAKLLHDAVMPCARRGEHVHQKSVCRRLKWK